ncbi:MAG: hypothetical protein ACE5H1_03345, partial [Thermodesulfobacteriota bacterium]
MSKERFVLGWQKETEKSQDINRSLSNRVRSVMDSPQGMWNYMTYRDAINILGVEPSDIYKEGRIDLDQKKWADFGWMLCFAGPPSSAVREMKKRTRASNINPYSPDLINPLREACAEIKLNRRRDRDFEV